MYTPLENATQGSAAWLAARAKHFCASEAAAALGMSKYATRDELLRQKATGLTEEVSPAKQRIFDAGHEAEALARPIAEGIAGTEFFPVVATREVDGLPLLASFDGIDVLDDLIWENKLLNQSLVQQVQAGDLEPHYWLQLEHQLLVSGATRALFTTSDGTPGGTHPLWYESKPERRAQLIAGWKQFAADLAAWVLPEAKPAPVVGKTPDNLPALLIQVTGAVTASNLPEFKAHALEVFKGINRTLTTDQDFATAESTVKWCADVESRLAAAKEHALSQTATIDELFKTIDDISAEARRTRLELDKLVKARKEEIRGEIVAGGITALREHIAQLNAAMHAPYMPQVPADFAGAIKGKRTVDSLRSAVTDELARAKIEASNIATRIHANVKTLEASGLVVPDAANLVLKAPDDLAAIIATRVAAEQQRQEAIRAEIAEKLQREAQAKAEADARAAAQAELALAKQNPEGQELSPAAQALHEQEGSENFARAHRSIVVSEPAPANVVPMRAAPAPAERTGTPTLKLGTINERLGGVLTISADGLRTLGFEIVARERGACLYHEADFPLMLAALVRHIEGVQEKAAA